MVYLLWFSSNLYYLYSKLKASLAALGSSDGTFTPSGWDSADTGSKSSCPSSTQLLARTGKQPSNLVPQPATASFRTWFEEHKRNSLTEKGEGLSTPYSVDTACSQLHISYKKFLLKSIHSYFLSPHLTLLILFDFISVNILLYI